MKKSVGAVLFLMLGLAVVATSQVSPSSVTADLAPGGSLTVDKTVQTPIIPPKPDIVFLSDTTGSMQDAIDNVKANLWTIMSTVLTGAPAAQFAVAEYRDVGDLFTFQLNQAITDDTAAVQNAINGWDASGGGDQPEAQLYALHELGTQPAIGFRPNSTRVIVWMGDSSGHDPSNGITEAQAIGALTTGANSPIRVIAVPVVTDYGDGLDNTGQATRITDNTGGLLMPAAQPAAVAQAILDGLSNLPITVNWTASANPGLVVTLTPASQTVTSGDPVYFTETISATDDAPQCNHQYGMVVFTDEAGNTIGTQTIDIHILDITPPLVASIEGVNPSGKNIPPAGNTTLPGPKGGMNDDGFYQLLAEDNCDPNPQIWVADINLTVRFGPFPSGIVVKFTEASKPPTIKPMGGPNSAVQWHIILPTDAVVFAVDASGNVSDPTIAYVPHPPK